MTALTLFDLAQQVRESVNHIDPDTGEIIENYAESRELFQNKAVACVAYAKEESATLESAKAMVKDMLAKIDAREKRLERFKSYLADCMKATGITEVKHDLGLFGAKLYEGRDESVELDEGAPSLPSCATTRSRPRPARPRSKRPSRQGKLWLVPA